MHYDIECYYNQVPVSNDSIEYTYFRQFLDENPHLLPYRTEWMIYHEDLKIAGSVDMVYRNPDGTLLIYDWKRCKENANGSYQIIEVPFLEKEIADLFEYRRTMLIPKVPQGAPTGPKAVPTGPKCASTLVEKSPTGGPKQGYKPKGLMIDLGGL